MSRAVVKVYLDEDGRRRLIGRADIPADNGPVFKVPLFGRSVTIHEVFRVEAVTHLPPGGGAPEVERAVVVAPGQLVELLPGWQPLAS